MSATLHQKNNPTPEQQPTPNFRDRLRGKPFVPIAWRPTTIHYDSTEQGISGSAGLGFMTDLFYDDPMFADFQKCLPARKSNASYDTELGIRPASLSDAEASRQSRLRAARDGRA